jgi:Bacterial nucleoid DNA-binding protein
MLKSDFTKKVKEALNLNSIKAAEDTVEKFTALVADLVKAGEEIPLGNLGKFVVVERAARKCRNPQTGETMDVPAKKAVKFKPATALKKMC